jgi:hypothetical protein
VWLKWERAEPSVPTDLLGRTRPHSFPLFPISRITKPRREDFTTAATMPPQNAAHGSFFPDSNFEAPRNIGAAHELRQNRSTLSLCRIFQATKMSMNTESGNHDE